MSFERPTPPPLTYPDLRAETEQGPRLLAFRILEFLPPEESDYTDRTTGTRAKIYPVLCDVMIIDGPNAGTVYRGWTARYAITNALRGASGNDPVPTTRPGAQLAIRAERSRRRGEATQTVYGNVPSDHELSIIESEFARFGGWDGGAPAPTAPAPATPAAAAAYRPGVPAASGQRSGSGAARPFGNR